MTEHALQDQRIDVSQLIEFFDRHAFVNFMYGCIGRSEFKQLYPKRRDEAAIGGSASS